MQSWKIEKYKIGEEDSGNSEHIILNHLTQMESCTYPFA